MPVFGLVEPLLLNEHGEEHLEFSRSEYGGELRAEAQPPIGPPGVVPDPIHVSGFIPVRGHLRFKVNLLDKVPLLAVRYGNLVLDSADGKWLARLFVTNGDEFSNACDVIQLFFDIFFSRDSPAPTCTGPENASAFGGTYSPSLLTAILLDFLADSCVGG